MKPTLKTGDRIFLIEMYGENLALLKGKVLGIENMPKEKPEDSGFRYKMEWYDDDGKVISRLPMMPDLDTWIMDDELNQQNLEEINFRNIDDLISKGDFLAVFSKKELEKVYEFLELERQIGSHNMAMEGGKFLLMGPDYIRDFFKLQSYHIKPDKEKEILIKRLINRSEDIYNLFIRASMKYLDNKEIKYSLKDVQKTMVRLATTAKQFWMSEANKFLNKEIE
jgi:hypothetical protein